MKQNHLSYDCVNTFSKQLELLIFLDGDLAIDLDNSLFDVWGLVVRHFINIMTLV